MDQVRNAEEAKNWFQSHSTGEVECLAQDGTGETKAAAYNDEAQKFFAAHPVEAGDGFGTPTTESSGVTPIEAVGAGGDEGDECWQSLHPGQGVGGEGAPLQTPGGNVGSEPPKEEMQSTAPPAPGQPGFAGDVGGEEPKAPTHA